MIRYLNYCNLNTPGLTRRIIERFAVTLASSIGWFQHFYSYQTSSIVCMSLLSKKAPILFLKSFFFNFAQANHCRPTFSLGPFSLPQIKMHMSKNSSFIDEAPRKANYYSWQFIEINEAKFSIYQISTLSINYGKNNDDP